MALSRSFDGAVVALSLMGALQLDACNSETARYLAPVAPDITNIATSARVTVGEDSYEARTSAALGAGLAGGDASLCRIYPDGLKIALLVLGGAVFARDRANHPAKLPPQFAEMVEAHQAHRIYLAPGAAMSEPGAPGEPVDWRGRRVIPVTGTNRFGSLLTYYFASSNGRMAGYELTLKNGEGGIHTASYLFKDWQERQGIPLFTTLTIHDRDKQERYDFLELELTRAGETPPEFVCQAGSP